MYSKRQLTVDIISKFILYFQQDKSHISYWILIKILNTIGKYLSIFNKKGFGGYNII